MSQFVSDEKKQEIIKKIRDEGLAVKDAGVDYGVSTKSIYRWLRDGVGGGGGDRNLILENNRLKKENEQLYSLLGRATAEMKRPKR